MKLLALLEKRRETWFLLFLLLLFFLLRFPSLFEPYWYGDEGIYQTIGVGLTHGRELYQGVWDNKPPLLYLFYAAVGGDQSAIRLVSAFFGMAAVVSVYVLSSLLFHKVMVVWATTIFFAVLFGIPFLEGNIANAENFMLFPIIAASILLLKGVAIKTSKKTSTKLVTISGILLGIAFLFKVTALFDLAALITFLLFTQHKKKERFPRQTIKRFVVSFFVPISLSFLYFLIAGGLSDYIQAAFFQNISYVGVKNQFVIPLGLLAIKLILLTIVLFILFSLRKSLQQPFLFILLWLSFSLFNAFFSHRPYTHYLLVLLPSASLLFGTLFLNRAWFRSLCMLVVLSLLIHQNFRLYNRVIPYYENFLAFTLTNKSVEEYRKFFDPQTPHDYELAQFITQHTDDADTIFIFGNNAQVYKLTNKLPPGRFTVAYHITANNDTFEETLRAVNTTKPKYVLVMNNLRFPLTQKDYTLSYTVGRTQIYERVL